MKRALTALIASVLLASCSAAAGGDDSPVDIETMPAPPDFSDPNDEAVPTIQDALEYCDLGLPAVSWNDPKVSDPDAGALAVAGRVQSVTDRSDLPGQPVFIDVGANYPQGFSIVLFDRENFGYHVAGEKMPDSGLGAPPEDLNGQLICAEGYVTFQDGRPQMVDTKELNSVTAVW